MAGARVRFGFRARLVRRKDSEKLVAAIPLRGIRPNAHGPASVTFKARTLPTTAESCASICLHALPLSCPGSVCCLSGGQVLAPCFLLTCRRLSSKRVNKRTAESVNISRRLQTEHRKGFEQRKLRPDGDLIHAQCQYGAETSGDAPSNVPVPRVPPSAVGFPANHVRLGGRHPSPGRLSPSVQRQLGSNSQLAAVNSTQALPSSGISADSCDPGPKVLLRRAPLRLLLRGM